MNLNNNIEKIIIGHKASKISHATLSKAFHVVKDHNGWEFGLYTRFPRQLSSLNQTKASELMGSSNDKTSLARSKEYLNCKEPSPSYFVKTKGKNNIITEYLDKNNDSYLSYYNIQEPKSISWVR